MDAYASFNENDERIECSKSNITLIVDAITFGKGTLYVAESKLYWKDCSQVISMNYDAMTAFEMCNDPKVNEKPCLIIFFNLNYNQNEDEEEEEISSLITIVPDNPKYLNEIYEAITDVQSLQYSYNVDGEDEVEGSDQESNLSESESDEHDDEDEVEGSDRESNLTESESDEHDDEDEVEVEESDRESNLTESESDEHEDSEKNSYTTISSTCTLENQETGFIDVSNQYRELDAKNGEKENQDEEVLINERKRKFEDLPAQEEKPAKIRKLWNLMKYPFQKNTSFNTSISENEPNISIDKVMAGKNNSLEPETAVCENNSNSVKAEEKNSQNNSETDEENEDTSTNETSQQFCKIM